jgi:hypothetical protein
MNERNHEQVLVQKMAAMLVRHLGDTMLSEEAHSTPAGRARAAEMLRGFGQALSNVFPHASPEDLRAWSDLANEVETGMYDRELAAAFARWKVVP